MESLLYKSIVSHPIILSVDLLIYHEHKQTRNTHSKQTWWTANRSRWKASIRATSSAVACCPSLRLPRRGRAGAGAACCGAPSAATGTGASPLPLPRRPRVVLLVVVVVPRPRPRPRPVIFAALAAAGLSSGESGAGGLQLRSDSRSPDLWQCALHTNNEYNVQRKTYCTSDNVSSLLVGAIYLWLVLACYY